MVGRKRRISSEQLVKITENHIAYAAEMNEKGLRQLASFLNKNGWESIVSEGDIEIVIKSFHDAKFFDKQSTFGAEPQYFRGRVK